MPEPWTGNSILIYDNTIMGEIKDFQFVPINLKRFSVNATVKTENGVIRIKRNDLKPLMKWRVFPSYLEDIDDENIDIDDMLSVKVTSDYLKAGQELHFYKIPSGEYMGLGKVSSLEYFANCDSIDLYRISFAPIDFSSTDKSFIALDGRINMNPRDIKKSVKHEKINDEESGVESIERTFLTADIDNDGIEERIVWTAVWGEDCSGYSAQESDEGSLYGGCHQLRVERGDDVIFTLTSDDISRILGGDWSYINDIHLLDINGDGIYELILEWAVREIFPSSGVSVLQWKDGKFHKTGVDYSCIAGAD
ncbi:MAG: hypothetical protein FWC40_09345 [Proteobacteria bacterium]|nr:hypothetical protein [Pseudomonadota bacterium]